MIRRQQKRIASRSKNYGKPRGDWHPPLVRLDAEGMRELRRLVFVRSGAQCEATKDDGVRCFAQITWYTFELDHVISRGKGGSDTTDNCIASCVPCHRQKHGLPQWSNTQ